MWVVSPAASFGFVLLGLNAGSSFWSSAVRNLPRGTNAGGAGRRAAFCGASPRLAPSPNSRQSEAGLSRQIRGSLAEFVAPEVISEIVVDQYAGPPDDVRRYLTAMPTVAAQYFGPSLELCKARYNTNWVLGARLDWTS